MDVESGQGAPRNRSALPLTVPLLLSLAVWGAGLWWPAPAGPPPDPLALELRRFRALTGDRERIEAIWRFGREQDPRVTVALVEVVEAELAKDRPGEMQAPALLVHASSTLVHYHIPKDEWLPAKYWTVALMWWKEHGDEVRHRAAALPQ